MISLIDHVYQIGNESVSKLTGISLTTKHLKFDIVDETNNQNTEGSFIKRYITVNFEKSCTSFCNTDDLAKWNYSFTAPVTEISYKSEMHKILKSGSNTYTYQYWPGVLSANYMSLACDDINGFRMP